MKPGVWLDEKRSALIRRINEALDQYDNAHITREGAREVIADVVEKCLTQVSDRAYSDGLEDAELDGDYEDDEDIEFEEDNDA